MIKNNIINKRNQYETHFIIYFFLNVDSVNQKSLKQRVCVFRHLYNYTQHTSFIIIGTYNIVLLRYYCTKTLYMIKS